MLYQCQGNWHYTYFLDVLTELALDPFFGCATDQSHMVRTHIWLSPKAIPLLECHRAGAQVASSLPGGGVEVVGGACFIAWTVYSRSGKGILLSLTPSRTSLGWTAGRTSAQRCRTPPEVSGPGSVSALPHLCPQGRQQRQFQAQVGDHTVT